MTTLPLALWSWAIRDQDYRTWKRISRILLDASTHVWRSREDRLDLLFLSRLAFTIYLIQVKNIT